jgi:hypothetical protein
MIIKSFSDRILLPYKKDVFRVHLYLKFIQYGIQPFENDIDIILELYLFGGYSNAEEQDSFFKLCLEKNYKKSKQSIRNTLSKYTNLGVLGKPKNTQLTVNERFIPKVECDKILLQHIVSHAE